MSKTSGVATFARNMLADLNRRFTFAINPEVYTVDGERFTGLNIRSFSAIEVFAEIFLHCLSHKQCISTHYFI